MELEMEFKLASARSNLPAAPAQTSPQTPSQTQIQTLIPTPTQAAHDGGAMRKAAKLLGFGSAESETETETLTKTQAETRSDENNNNCSDHNNNNNEMQKLKQVEQQQFQSGHFSEDDWPSLSPPHSAKCSAEKAELAPSLKRSELAADDGHQLMSIDPTLCHSTDDINRPVEVGVELELEPTEEEQTANEEFNSSSSSCSFGPMSITLNSSASQQQTLARANEGANEEELDTEEPNSNQSGSVLTVIDQHEEQQLCNLSDEDSLKDTSRSNDVTASLEADGDGSNIGVAFESLQFDDEIKSARQEEVDDELLLVGPQQQQQHQQMFPPPAASKRSNLTRFPDASTVKSVCNFITAAICDATKQVDLVSSRSRKVVEQEVGDHKQKKEESSLQRATFVQDEEEETNVSLVGTEGELEVTKVEAEEVVEQPKADLSSIFEANVRREIERFETNSSRNSRCKLGQQQAKSGLTEWRIAEEIRLFNERELELKRRFVAEDKPEQSICNNSSESKHQQPPSKQEATARFGKALQVAQRSQGQQQACKPEQSIKLSTTATSNGTTSISMHKFISSGGKRFVFTSSTSNCGNQHQKLASKSMSNLNNSNNNNNNNSNNNNIEANYGKETPLVKPGIARKAIETFRRFQASNEPSRDQQADGTGHQFPCNGNGEASYSNLTTTSAEWKIQEELREMRAREQELRNQRKLSLAAKLKQATSKAKNGFAVKKDAGELEEQVQPLAEATSETQDDRLSFSSESLYPIKQTIAEFRKFSTTVSNNNASSNNNAATAASTTTTRPQRARPQSGSGDDYESKVGGQRRKTSMIERWENGIGRQGQ